MRFLYQNPALEQQMAQARTVDALDRAIRAVAGLIPSFFDPAIFGRQAYWRAMDQEITNVVRRLGLKDVPAEKSNDNVCILATRVYDTGGHSHVVADLSERLGAERTTLVFTDLYRQLRYGNLLGEDPDASPYKRRAMVLLRSDTDAEKVLELYQVLCAIRPTRILLLCNHMDFVAVAGAWPFRSVTEFIHHADHLPALGATLPFASHVDLNYPIHLACREAGLDPVYASMSAGAAPQALTPPAHQGLRMVTCGSLPKYRGPARYRWADYAVAALQAPGSEIIHIGPVDDEFRQEIREALEGAGLDPGRYRYLGVVPDLRAALADQGADVFLGSYPAAGGRASLEAMASGLPTIVPEDPDQPPLTRDRWPFPHFLKVYSPQALPALLARHAELAAAARAPEAIEGVATHFRLFADYVDGKPVPPVVTDDVLPD